MILNILILHNGVNIYSIQLEYVDIHILIRNDLSQLQWSINTSKSLHFIHELLRIKFLFSGSRNSLITASTCSVIVATIFSLSVCSGGAHISV